MVTFKPDARVFETTEMNFDLVSRRLRELAYLNRGVRMTLTDERRRGAAGEGGGAAAHGPNTASRAGCRTL